MATLMEVEVGDTLVSVAHAGIVSVASARAAAAALRRDRSRNRAKFWIFMMATSEQGDRNVQHHAGRARGGLGIDETL